MVRIFIALLCLLLWNAPVPLYAQRIAPVVSAQAATNDPYTPHIPAQALQYQRERRIVGLLGIGWNLLGLWLMLRTAISARLRNAVSRTFPQRHERGVTHDSETPTAPPFRVLLLYYLGFSALLLLWNLPVGLLGLHIEQQFGFSRQSAGGYLGDTALNYVFNLPIVLLVWGGYRLYARTPRHWWQILWGILVPILVFIVILQPVVFAPAFNHYTPLPDTPLRNKILNLAAKAGITGGSVFVEDTSRRTTHVNAYVTGVGPTTRIVINDTALQTLPEDQILAMVGHEMGHYVEGHIWFGLMSGIFGAGFFLWLLAQILPRLVQRKARIYYLHGITDVAALPLLLLTVTLFLLIQNPIANGISRYMEHRADTFGLRVTGLNDAMARLFVGFAERDYSDPDPPPLLQFWFGTHPTLAERIAYARSYHPHE